MNSKLKRVLLAELAFLTINIYINLFVNFFLWKTGNTIKSFLEFNSITYVTAFIVFTLCSALVLKNRTKYGYYISASVSIVLFIMLYNSNSISFNIIIILAALLFGSSIGSFYGVNNYMLQMLATSTEISSYISNMGYINAIITLLIPLTQALLISHCGFKVSFISMLVLSIIFLIVVSRVELSKEKAINVKLSIILEDINKLKFPLSHILFMTLYMLVYYYLGSMQSILLFTKFKDLASLSYFNILIVAVSTACFLILVRIKNLHSQYLLNVFSILVIIVLGYFLMGNGSLTLIIMLAGVQVFYQFLCNRIPLHFIKENVKEAHEKIILLTKREFYLALGRTINYLMMYLIIEHLYNYMVIAIVLITGTIPIMFRLMKEKKSPKLL